MTLWPHQQQAIQEVLAAIARGERRLCLTSPTGGGKSLIMQLLAQDFLARSQNVVLYASRKFLIEQISGGLVAAGIYHGVRAAGYADEREHPFQVSSIPTEYSRVIRKNAWGLHDADLVLVDEGHLHTGKMSRRILDAHYEAGATYVLITATPIGLGKVCDTLIQAGTTSELRACGALVPAIHYGPDEPDFKAWRIQQEQELTEGQTRKIMGEVVEGKPSQRATQLFGRVWDWFEKLNPERKPTLLFASGVAESLWFAQEFSRRGVPAAHIDGEEIWYDGQFHRSERDIRSRILQGSKDGRIPCLCNRFVLREGVDCPWLAHGILATVFGSLQSYLQSGGRLLRASPGLDHVCIQDHGGNWWRWGSLNADREWRLDESAAALSGLRAERLRTKQEPEPFLCPGCGRVWMTGTSCNPARGGCGYVLEARKRARPVVSVEGELVELVGPIFKTRRICQQPSGPADWEKMYWRARNPAWNATFAQAAARFAKQHHWAWPDRSWPFMPVRPYDWYTKVAYVAPCDLIPKSQVPEEVPL